MQCFLLIKRKITVLDASCFFKRTYIKWQYYRMKLHAYEGFSKSVVQVVNVRRRRRKYVLVLKARVSLRKTMTTVSYLIVNLTSFRFGITTLLNFWLCTVIIWLVIMYKFTGTQNNLFEHCMCRDSFQFKEANIYSFYYNFQFFRSIAITAISLFTS